MSLHTCSSVMSKTCLGRGQHSPTFLPLVWLLIQKKRKTWHQEEKEASLRCSGLGRPIVAQELGQRDMGSNPPHQWLWPTHSLTI